MRLQGLWPAHLTLLLLAFGDSAAQAGTFEIDYVSAVIKESNYGYIAVEVHASATYVGSRDPGDQSYQINTLLNNNRDGDSLSNWSAPDDEGGSLTGSGITEGMVIHCNSQPCAAYGNLYREYCPTTYNYRGRGAVAIYHQNNPEIDTKDTFTYLVECATPPDGGGGGGGGGGVDPCGSSAATVSTTSSIGSGELLSNEPGSYTLDRRDEQGQMRYLLEEWAATERPGPGDTDTTAPGLKSGARVPPERGGGDAAAYDAALPRSYRRAGSYPAASRSQTRRRSGLTYGRNSVRHRPRAGPR